MWYIVQLKWDVNKYLTNTVASCRDVENINNVLLFIISRNLELTFDKLNHFLFAEKAQEMKAMAEQGLNMAKDKCKVQ